MVTNPRILLISIILISFFSICNAEDFWMKTNFTEKTYDVFCPNNDEVFIVYDWDTYISQNMGNSWEKFLDCRLIHINKTSDEIYFDRYGGTIFVLDRNTGVIDSLASVAAGRMYEVNDSFIMRSYSNVSKSNLDWSNIYSVMTVNGGEEITCFAVDSLGTYYAGSTDFMNIDQPGGVYKSYDEGETWTYPDLPNHFVRAMAVDSEGRIFVGTCGHYSNGTGLIYRSIDNGNTWQIVAGGTYVFSMAINSDDEIFVGLDADGGSPGVLYSEDNGDNWTLLNSGFPGGDVNDIAISPDGYVYLATQIGVYKSINSTTGIEDSESESVKNFELFQNYPNPFNNETIINFNLEKSCHVQLNIFNSKGELINNIKNQKMSRGHHSVSLNADNLGSGVYYYSLKVDNETVSIKKMLYVR